MKTTCVLLGLLAVTLTAAEPTLHRGGGSSGFSANLNVVLDFADGRWSFGDFLKRLGFKSDNEQSQEIFFKLSGSRDVKAAIAYLKKVTGLTRSSDLQAFLKLCVLSSSWDNTFNFFSSFEASTDISVLVRLINIVSNKTNVLEGFKVIGNLTGEANINGLLKILLRISGESDVAKCGSFFQKQGNGKGVEGVNKYVLSLTAGVGSPNFANLFLQLKGEADINASLKLLTSAFNVNVYGDAIISLNKLLRTKTFAESIISLKQLTAQAQLKLAIESLLNVSGQASLSVVVNNLFKITGAEDLATVGARFKAAFNLDFIQACKQVNSITKNTDVFAFFNVLLQVTNKSTIVDACAEINVLNTENVATLDFIAQVQAQSGNSAVDVFRNMLTFTKTTNIRAAWKQVTVATKVTSIFKLFSSIKVYSKVSFVDFFSTVLRVSGKTTIEAASNYFVSLTSSKSFFDSVASIKAVVKVDFVNFLNIVVTLGSRATLEEASSVLQKRTRAKDFLASLRIIIQNNNNASIEQVIENIKRNGNSNGSGNNNESENNNSSSNDKEDGSENTDDNEDDSNSEDNSDKNNGQDNGQGKGQGNEQGNEQEQDNGKGNGQGKDQGKGQGNGEGNFEGHYKITEKGEVLIKGVRRNARCVCEL